MAPSDALLRTFAAVPPGTRVVDLACGAGRHLDPLARLGFDVWGTESDPVSVDMAREVLTAVLGDDEARRRVTAGAPDALGYPDAWADWAVFVARLEHDLAAALAEAARVLAPGGWVWVETDRPDGLEHAAEAAGLVVAEEPAEGDGRTHAIFRRPGGVG